MILATKVPCHNSFSDPSKPRRPLQLFFSLRTMKWLPQVTRPQAQPRPPSSLLRHLPQPPTRSARNPEAGLSCSRRIGNVRGAAGARPMTSLPMETGWLPPLTRVGSPLLRKPFLPSGGAAWQRSAFHREGKQTTSKRHPQCRIYRDE
jgi:hypothetical protein